MRPRVTEGHACFDGVDRGSCWRRDVDPEVEALRVAVSVPRVVEVGANRVLAVEGLDGPAVPGMDPVVVADGADLGEGGSRLLGPEAAGVRAATKPKTAETMAAEAMIGLLRLLICAVLVSMAPPSSGAQTGLTVRTAA